MMPTTTLNALAVGPELSADRSLRLLVVDDQTANIQAVYQVFTGSYTVFMANSGPAALALCHENPPDLVLLDVVMPQMDGLEVCRRLKASERTSNIPVIFVTGGNSTSEEDACWEAGGVDFVSKPINPLTLRNRVRAHLTLKLQSDVLRSLAFVDGLTGIANRRQFDEQLPVEIGRCKRMSLPLGLILLDIDFFKRYNDRYGHQAGDACLRQVAMALRATLARPGDLVARYGGEEFVCILPNTPLEGALRIGTKLEAAVRALEIEHQLSDVATVVSISGGIVAGVPPPDCEPATLLAQADRLLYQAKQEGRARVKAESLATAGIVTVT
ncbi:diguanylate cyclase [Duganella guangzhouensis]|nr:diguanylate cyclase [Duganella guangzhouensis]